MGIAFNENQCGFCKSDVPRGATVCVHCGAFKGQMSQSSGGSGIFWPGVILVLFGLLGIWLGFNATAEYNDYSHNHHYIDWGAIGISFITSIIGGALVYFFGKKGAEPTWLKRH